MSESEAPKTRMMKGVTLIVGVDRYHKDRLLAFGPHLTLETALLIETTVPPKSGAERRLNLPVGIVDFSHSGLNDPGLYRWDGDVILHLKESLQHEVEWAGQWRVLMKFDSHYCAGSGDILQILIPPTPHGLNSMGYREACRAKKKAYEFKHPLESGEQTRMMFFEGLTPVDGQERVPHDPKTPYGIEFEVPETENEEMSDKGPLFFNHDPSKPIGTNAEYIPSDVPGKLGTLLFEPTEEYLKFKEGLAKQYVTSMPVSQELFSDCLVDLPDFFEGQLEVSWCAAQFPRVHKELIELRLKSLADAREIKTLRKKLEKIGKRIDKADAIFVKDPEKAEAENPRLAKEALQVAEESKDAREKFPAFYNSTLEYMEDSKELRRVIHRVKKILKKGEG